MLIGSADSFIGLVDDMKVRILAVSARTPAYSGAPISTQLLIGDLKKRVFEGVETL